MVTAFAGSNPISLAFVATTIGGAAATEYVVKPVGRFLWDMLGEYFWGIKPPGSDENDGNAVVGG